MQAEEQALRDAVDAMNAAIQAIADHSGVILYVAAAVSLGVTVRDPTGISSDLLTAIDSAATSVNATAQAAANCQLDVMLLTADDGSLAVDISVTDASRAEEEEMPLIETAAVRNVWPPDILLQVSAAAPTAETLTSPPTTTENDS